MMSAQKSITAFFKPRPDNKRKNEGDEDDNAKKSEHGGNKKVLCAVEKTVNTSNGQPNTKKAIQHEIDNLFKTVPGALTTNIGHTWFSALKGEFNKPYFKQLSDFISEERKKATIFPPRDEVYSWTRFCEIDQVKVIILGQDPYHGPKQAHGIAFSVNKGVLLPPSLVNIFKEVENDYPEFSIPKDGLLTGWAKQGVLMLNACLTVRSGLANSHANKGWEMLTDAVVKYFNDNYQNRVFLLWGLYAQKKGSFIDKKKHLVLQTAHPSPLSAHRGFFNCGHFKGANKYLTEHGLEPIDWTKLV